MIKKKKNFKVAVRVKNNFKTKVEILSTYEKTHQFDVSAGPIHRSSWVGLRLKPELDLTMWVCGE